MRHAPAWWLQGPRPLRATRRFHLPPDQATWPPCWRCSSTAATPTRPTTRGGHRSPSRREGRLRRARSPPRGSSWPRRSCAPAPTPPPPPPRASSPCITRAPPTTRAWCARCARPTLSLAFATPTHAAAPSPLMLAPSPLRLPAPPTTLPPPCQVRVLLAHGADPRAATRQGITPLHVASFLGLEECVAPRRRPAPSRPSALPPPQAAATARYDSNPILKPHCAILIF